MSVSNPMDSGGGAGVLTQGLEELAEQMNTVGGWAELMAEEHLNSTVEDDVDETGGGEDEVDGRKLPTEPPFKIQVTNVSTSTEEQDLFFYFGGEEFVTDLSFNSAKGSAEIEFSSQAGLRAALTKDDTLAGRKLTVYVIDGRRGGEKRDRQDRRENNQQQDERHEGYNSRYNNNYNRGGGHSQQQYSRQSSKYGSQASLYSNDARAPYDNNRRGGHGDRNNDYHNRGPPSHYGSSDNFHHPADRRGGYRDDNRYQNRGGGYRGGAGGYNNYEGRGGGYGGNQGGYDRNRGGRHSYGGPPYSSDLQRSSSYSHDKDRPAPIHRSRTDSTNMDYGDPRRRGGDMTSSRTSSRLSMNTLDEGHATLPQVKKPTNKDIFGDAKPVNTADKIREIEEKQERERKLAIQRAKEKAAQEAAAAAAMPPPRSVTPHEFNPNAQAFTMPRVPSSYSATLPNPKRFHNSNQYHHGGPGQYNSSGGTYYGHPPHVDNNAVSQSYEKQPYGGPPGTISILPRPEGESDSAREGTDGSPPLDPVHTEQRTTEDHREESRDDRTQPSSRSNSETQPSSTQSQQKKLPPTHVRTFHRSDLNTAGGPIQKSATSGHINESSHRGGRGGRGGGNRGGYRGKDRRSSYSSTGGHDGGEAARQQQPTEHAPATLEKRDHHGSQTSVRSRGSKGSHYRGGSNYAHKEHRHRDDRRPPREDRPPNEQRPPKQHTAGAAEKRPEVKKDSSADQKSSRSSETASRSSPAVKKEATPPTTPSTAGDKKKDKKKNKKDNGKGEKNLTGNKFAALLGADD